MTVSGERNAHLLFQLILGHLGCRYAEATADSAGIILSPATI